MSDAGVVELSAVEAGVEAPELDAMMAEFAAISRLTVGSVDVSEQV